MYGIVEKTMEKMLLHATTTPMESSKRRRRQPSDTAEFRREVYDLCAQQVKILEKIAIHVPATNTEPRRYSLSCQTVMSALAQ